MGSRLHMLGSIYLRTKGLIEAGVIRKSEIPVWFDIYTHFPPIREPVYQLPKVNNVSVNKIFYPEDVLRSKIQKTLKNELGVIDLSDNTSETNTKKWIKICNDLISKGVSEEEAVKSLRESFQANESAKLIDQIIHNSGSNN